MNKNNFSAMLLLVSSFAQENENKFAFEINSGVSMATKEIAGTKLNQYLASKEYFKIDLSLILVFMGARGMI